MEPAVFKHHSMSWVALSHATLCVVWLLFIMHRPSQSQQAPGPATLARFQLAKFSYATTSINHRGPITWSHVFGNGDIIGIFEKYVIFSSKKVLFSVCKNQETLVRKLATQSFCNIYMNA